MLIAIYLRTVLGYARDSLEKVCVNLLDDYFISDICFSLLQDEHQPPLRSDALKFVILSISRQLCLRFRLYLIPSYKHSIHYTSLFLAIRDDRKTRRSVWEMRDDIHRGNQIWRITVLTMRGSRKTESHFTSPSSIHAISLVWDRVCSQ
jgi:hypothetical protein